MITFFVSTTKGKDPINVHACVNSPNVHGDVVVETCVVVGHPDNAFVCRTDQEVKDAVAKLKYGFNACPNISESEVVEQANALRKALADKLRARAVAARKAAEDQLDW